MATVLNHELGADTPANWEHKRNIILELQYRIENDAYKYSYRLINESIEEESLVPGGIDAVEWSPFMEREQFIADLDINIRDHSLVEVRTFSNPPEFPISWSLTKDGIVTLHDRKHLYGRLRYKKGNRWVKRTNFGPGECSTIRFKAKLNSNLNDRLHKFSYNVLLRKLDGVFGEHEIDPDIRNPPPE